MDIEATDIQIRKYRSSDYPCCESLVNQAWNFDSNFPPDAMASLAKYIYTMGSIAGSNFFRIIETQNMVISFLFGFNEKEPLPKHSLQKLSSKLGIMKQLMFMKGMKFKAKTALLKSINTHELNRIKLIARGKSEITLFVIDPAYQGAGLGKMLFTEFKTFCRESGVGSILVETNHLEAASFYERIGFKHLGDFNSPLHNHITKNGQACMYECLL